MQKKLPGRGPPCPREPCSNACPKHVKGGSSLRRACSPPPSEQLLLLPLTKSPLQRRRAPNHAPGNLPCPRMASPCIRPAALIRATNRLRQQLASTDPNHHSNWLRWVALPCPHLLPDTRPLDAGEPVNLLSLTSGALLSVSQQPPFDGATPQAVSLECGSSCSSSPRPGPSWLARGGRMEHQSPERGARWQKVIQSL